MNNPFPGMNPYLEQSEFWSDFHTQLVTALARVLIPQVLPKYRVVTEKWIYQIADAATIGIGRPDITVQQRREQPSNGAIASAPAATSTQPIQVILPMPQEIAIALTKYVIINAQFIPSKSPSRRHSIFSTKPRTTAPNSPAVGYKSL